MRAGDGHGGSARGRAQLPSARWYGALVIVLVLGACTHGSNHASSTTSTAATASSTPSTPSTPSTTVASSTTLPPTAIGTQPAPSSPPPTGPPAAAGCRSADLALSVGPQNGAAGTQYFEIGFRNDASFPCVLTGYPGVSFLDASGTQIGVPASRDDVTHSPVTIASHESAYARVGVGNPGVFDCAGVTPNDIRVFPPNETVAVLVPPPTGLLVCPTQGAPLVDPVVDHADT